MEVWSLKCFLAVADALSFSKAAETLYVSQPAISQQISEMERQLGVELFDRSKRRIRLTPAGAALYHEAHDIVLRHDSLPELVRKAVEENTPRRCFRLGFERGVAWSTGFRARIQQVNEELERTHANLVISTDTVEQAGVVDLLRENRIDMAFVFEDTAPDMAWAETFPTRCSENMYLVYRAEEALLGQSAREILMEKGVVMTGGDPVGTQQCYRLLSALGAQPKIQMCRDIVDAVMVAESGSRAGLFLECIARRVQERGMIKRELTEYPVRIKALCRRKGCSPLTEEFLRLLWEREKTPD